MVNKDLIEDKQCMNLKLGGEGGFVDEFHQQNCKEGASKWIKKQWLNEDYRKHISNCISNEMVNRHKEGKVKYDNFKNKKHSDETKKIIAEKNSISQKGDKNSQYGKIWIKKDSQSIKISKSEIDQYFLDGWTKGRKMKNLG